MTEKIGFVEGLDKTEKSYSARLEEVREAAPSIRATKWGKVELFEEAGG